MQSKKIALIIVDDFSMYQFHGGLVRSLVADGHQVTTIVPPGDYGPQLESLGARCISVPMLRFISPIADILLFFRLYSIFRRESFDIVHNMTIKPNIYGTFAARAAGVPAVYCLIEGLGYVFADHIDWRPKLLRRFVSLAYSAALNLADKTWFVNENDLEAFISWGIIRPIKGHLIKSSGINLSQFDPSSEKGLDLPGLKNELGIPQYSRCVLMVTARRIWAKGIREYYEAADFLRTRHPDWRFILVAPPDKGTMDFIPDDYFYNQKPDNVILIEQFRADIRRFISLADIVTLPSYYREGFPLTLLEGMAMGKPLVTTDNVGCRDTVIDGRNGFLVPIRDSKALAGKLSELMESDSLRRKFGMVSRRRAEEEFDERVVASRIKTEIYKFTGPKSFSQETPASAES